MFKSSSVVRSRVGGCAHELLQLAVESWQRMFLLVAGVTTVLTFCLILLEFSSILMSLDLQASRGPHAKQVLESYQTHLI